jgi:dipeptidyl aminopeptidase/acylaminoacyl peptidase
MFRNRLLALESKLESCFARTPMAEAAIPLERFLNIRSSNGATFSPDGRFLAFLNNTTGVPQLWQVPVEGGWPTLLTFAHDAVRGAAYSPTQHQLVFSMDTGGNERTQLHLLRGKAGGTDHGLGDGWDAIDLSREPKAIHQFGGWSHDGNRFAFAANRTKPDRFDVYVQKLGQEARLLKEGPGGYYSPIGWSPDDRLLLISRNMSNFNHDLFTLDVESGAERHLTPHEGDAQFDAPRWSADGKTILCASNFGGMDITTFTTIDLASGKITTTKPRAHELETIEVSKKGRWIALVYNENGRSRVFLRNERDEPHVAGPDLSLELPLGVIAGLEFSPDETKLAMTFDGPRHNPDVWIWDFEKKKPRQLTHSSRAGIAFSNFVEPELVKFKSFDGLEIPAWFYAPKPGTPEAGQGLAPVIVYPHGGPESQTRPNFSALFQYFVSRGYGIFAPNVRGSSGYGTRFMNLDNTVKRMDSVKDMAHGVMWLHESGRADPKRIAVYGGSYGGFMVLAGVTNYPDLFAAGVDVVGIANFATFLENTGAYRRANREAEYGNLREHADFFKQISPIHHVDKIKCPMMVIHGANDPRVPVGEAEQIVAALKQRGVPVEYLRYEDEGHGLVKLKNRLDAYPRMVAFLDKHLRKG